MSDANARADKIRAGNASDVESKRRHVQVDARRRTDVVEAVAELKALNELD